MRISDWSSDVCSSDLHYLYASKILPHPEEPARASSPGRRLEGRVDAAAASFSVASMRRGSDAVVQPLQGFTMNVTASLCDLSAVELRQRIAARDISRSEEHTSELQSLMLISYAVFCLKKNIVQ